MIRPSRLTAAMAVAVTLAGIVLVSTAAPAVGHPGPTNGGPPHKPPAGHPHTPAEVVVKVDLAGGHTISDVAAAFPIQIDSAILASRGIYLVRSTDPRYQDDPKHTQQLADLIDRSSAVVYAEPNYETGLADTQFHGWPDGSPSDAGTDPAVWSDQPAATELQLDAVHARNRGAGTVIAVLDTGVDPTHPALAGRLLPGWDYVGDDADPTEVADRVDDNGNGILDEAYGHGTFVGGLVALVAPDARILPERVLDSDGYTNVFVVAQAILDAADAGANVINLSLGTPDRLQSQLLNEAITTVQRRGVVVVAAAGNDANGAPHYPAALKDVLSVSALSAGTSMLANFADWGRWVDVAAPGQHIAGPVPGGGYAWWAGTSMAAPFAAGQIALLHSSAPALGEHELVDAVNHTTTAMEPSRLAFGAVDIPASLDYAERHRP